MRAMSTIKLTGSVHSLLGEGGNISKNTSIWIEKKRIIPYVEVSVGAKLRTDGTGDFELGCAVSYVDDY